MTEYDVAILLGLVLGSGYIDPNGKIFITHSNKEYCEFKAKLLHSICGGKDVKVYKDRNCYSIKKYSKRFKHIRTMLYPNRVKEINDTVLNNLQPISLALWWMDRGYVHKNKSLSFFTYTNPEETECIRQFFLNKYNIQWDVAYNKHSCILKCEKNVGKMFLNLIKDVMVKVPTMSHKMFDI